MSKRIQLLQAFVMGLVVLFGVVQIAVALPAYTFTDLGNMMRVYGLSDSGTATGENYTGGLTGYIWNTTAGCTTLPSYPGNTMCRGYDVNVGGIVVGEAHNGSGWRATMWVAGTPIDLGCLNPANPNSHAYGINDSGAVVGGSSNWVGLCDAFLWENAGTGMMDLGTLGGSFSTVSYTHLTLPTN